MASPTLQARRNVSMSQFAQDSTNDPRVRMWGTRRRQSQDLKQLYESKWQYYWSQYRAFSQPLGDPSDWWRSSETIPTIFKIIHTLLPRYVLGMFQSPDWFSAEARNARNEEYEQLVYSLLRTTVEEMKLFPKMYEALLYSLIVGHAWGKVVWREEYEPRQVLVPTPIPVRRVLLDQYGGEAVSQIEAAYGAEVLDQDSPVMGVKTEMVEEEVYNGPDFEWRPVDRVFPDPSGNYKWVIEDISTTLEELEETQKQIGVYDEERLNALSQLLTSRSTSTRPQTPDAFGHYRQGTAGGVTAFDYQREPASTEGIPEHYVSPMRDGTGVVLQQDWGWVPPNVHKYKDSQWRLTVIAEGKHLLRDDPAPTPDQRPPYFPIRSVVVPGRLYGESLINWIGPLADQQTRLANMRLDEVFLGVWGQFLARKDSIMSDNQLLVQPGGIVLVEPRPGEKVGETFARLQRQPMMPEAYTEDSYRQTQAEHASFASDIFQGVGGAAGTTATEVERRLQQGGAPHVLSVMYNDYTVAKELLVRAWKWLQMRLPREKVVRMAGDRWAMADITTIQTPVDIIVGGGLFALSKDARIQMDQELLQMASNPAFAQFIKPDKVLMRWAQDRGWKNPENYIKTQEEVLIEQYQAAMAQANQQAALGAPQDAGGALPAQAGPNGQANLPSMPNMPYEGGEAALVGGQLAPGGLVAPAV